MRTIMKKYSAAIMIAALLSISSLLSGCTNNTTSNPPEKTPQTEAATPPVQENADQKPPSDTTNTTDSSKPNDQTNQGTQAPADIGSKKVLKTIQLQNGYSKKIERLVDGGERITISDSTGKVKAIFAEYDGVITSVNGMVITVKVEHDGERTITIPKDAYIDDEEGLGLKVGNEIEWTVNDKGVIEKVEIED